MFSWFSGKRKESAVYFVLSIFFLVFFGCNRAELTRARAERIIRDSKKTLIPLETAMLCGCIDSLTFQNEEVVDEEILRSLVAEGLITVTSDALMPKDRYLIPLDFLFLGEFISEGSKYVEFTFEGNKYVKEIQKSPQPGMGIAVIKLGEKRVIKVIDVSNNYFIGDISKIVKCQWEFNFTPFGLVYRKIKRLGFLVQVSHPSFIFVLKNGNWKILEESPAISGKSQFSE